MCNDDFDFHDEDSDQFDHPLDHFDKQVREPIVVVNSVTHTNFLNS